MVPKTRRLPWWRWQFMHRGTVPKVLWNFLYFQCYWDDISTTPQMAEPRSWQWPQLGCELRLSVAFEPLSWLHSKPIPARKAHKRKQNLLVLEWAACYWGREEREAGNTTAPFPTEPRPFQHVWALVRHPVSFSGMSRERSVHFCLSP